MKTYRESEAEIPPGLPLGPAQIAAAREFVPRDIGELTDLGLSPHQMTRGLKTWAQAAPLATDAGSVLFIRKHHAIRHVGAMDCRTGSLSWL